LVFDTRAQTIVGVDLTAGSDGNTYGTTEGGGLFAGVVVCQNNGCGVVFRVTPPGTFTVLHALDGVKEANYPLGVILASDGNLYGTSGNFNPGTLFRVNPTDGQFKTIHSFPSGVFPVNRLTEDSNGTLYGMSRSSSARTFNPFSSTLTGPVKNVPSLPIPFANGQNVGPLLQATDGNLWTTAIYKVSGYLSNYGEVLALSPGGVAEHQLPLSGTNGATPVAGVMQGTTANGNPAYGTAAISNPANPVIMPRSSNGTAVAGTTLNGWGRPSSDQDAGYFFSALRQ